jgi:16S rRNA (cytosine967-C5)-methyltransferase
VTRGNPLLSPLAAKGLFLVQDEASQIVGEVVLAKAGERILDACAAPGGKTLTMAAAMGNAGMLVATDVRARRVRLLADTVSGAGAACVRVVQANAAQALPFDAIFDCVLVDAPCTGLGTLRRDPDIKWRRTPGDFEAVTELQLRILTTAAAAVRPGGRIVYATCSSEPEENELVVSRFLESQPGFRAAPLAFAPAPDLINSAGHLQTLPFRDRLEAFFAAAVARRP